MRIDLRNERRERVGRLIVDPGLRPVRAPIGGSDKEVFLHWEGALDDDGRLRRCLSCGCSDLYREKAFPQVTGLVVVMAFGGAAAGTLGLATTGPSLAALFAVLVLDVSILVFSRLRLVCYRCHTSYRNLELARYHRRWDRSIAERFTPAASGGTT